MASPGEKKFLVSDIHNDTDTNEVADSRTDSFDDRDRQHHIYNPSHTRWVSKLSNSRFGAVLFSAHFCYLTVILFLTILNILLLINTHSASNSKHGNPQPVPSPDLPPLCGTSPEEARALGCEFDVYVNGWLPAACYDRSVASNSESNSSIFYPLAAGQTTFPIYWDENFTQPATLEDVEKAAFENGEDGLDVQFHTTYGYHRAHCLHLWRLAASALERASKGERGVGVFYKVASYTHAEHCNTIILEGDNRDPNKKDVITPGTARCVGLDDLWNESYGWAGRWKEISG
ncbi:hypothetical protein BGW36DRAFT_428150 [Talaromyces proteolyticus]|uniref:Uncharacterized protein n=1 Tax=Talaromyces proteolyticus TaxID=1131652 RepID=A0AAD4PZM0_9EURO|nr:uncharacterized protein BGW36DRAFT_428150 [Talaromyces proteolyticus]KAH8696126.1 hypothetical protein BGW36DRAFT_428150 [Talaromyces proteolyticus]